MLVRILIQVYTAIYILQYIHCMLIMFIKMGSPILYMILASPQSRSSERHVCRSSKLKFIIDSLMSAVDIFNVRGKGGLTA